MESTDYLVTSISRFTNHKLSFIDPIFNKAVFTGISKVDTTAPKATKIESLGIDKVVIYFSEAMKASITDISNYSIDEGLSIKKAETDVFQK